MREIPLIDRRRIEAGVLVPLIRALHARFDRDAVNDVVRAVITRLARETGRELAAEIGGDPIDIVEAVVPRFDEGGALEIELVARDEKRYEFDVKRCRFAELYRELGVPELGFLLSCQRDFALAEGIDPGLRLERSQTIMEGAPHCDFRFRKREPPTRDDGDETGQRS